jgi:two-component system sensor histidine kinase QseC
VALPVLAAALSFAIGRALGSLRAIARAIDARDPKRLEPVSVAHVPAEVRSIVERLNALFDRIAALLERERAFTADAAHELRTPLAAIRAQAQVARESAEEDERSHALDQVMVGCDRAARLSDQLLVMARLDAAEWSQQFAVCDLGEIAREVLGELAQIAHSRGVALELECAGRVEVFGVASLLHILLRNLVDNAIRYGAHRSQVRIETDSRSRDPVLQVCDDGPGIPVEQRDRVLDRFHRGLGHDEPGAGLGLSIVVRIATLHGATLTLGEGPDGRGLEASIRFPPPRLTTER